MRITVFGATGGISREVSSQALAAGHHVTAVVRDPARLSGPRAENFSVVTADVTDPAAIAPALDGADAAVSALGSRRGDSRTICGDGARGILGAMTTTGVRRLVAVSASGLFREAGEPAVTRYLLKPLLQAILKHATADAHQMEDLITGSAADWTIMRPTMLTDRPLGVYRTALDRYVSRRVGRADVAQAIVRALGDPSTVGHRVNVGI